AAAATRRPTTRATAWCWRSSPSARAGTTTTTTTRAARTRASSGGRSTSRTTCCARCRGWAWCGTCGGRRAAHLNLRDIRPTNQLVQRRHILRRELLPAAEELLELPHHPLVLRALLRGGRGVDLDQPAEDVVLVVEHDRVAQVPLRALALHLH